MEAVFLKVFNMSIAAGWLTLAVVVLRLLLKKAPKALTCLLWVLVGVRLVCPFSFESVLSLIPSGETVPPEAVTAAAPNIDSGFYVVDRVVNTVISPSFYPQPENSATPLQIVTFIAAAVWLVGIAVMLLYAAVSYLRLRHRVREAAFVRDNIWACDAVATPFILGLFRPRILLPSSLPAADADYVLAHENAHLKRRDHWWKPLGFLLLAVHWFNPLMWLAYTLLCRDIELACDERVVRDMDTEQVKAYSVALLDCSVPRRMLAACPLAFGEVAVKSRIKSVLHYKKPAFWVILVAIVACAATAVCFLTDPVSRYTEIPSYLDVYIMQTVMERHAPKDPEHVTVEAHKVLLAETVGDTTTVYAWVMEMTYSCEDGQLKAEGGSHIPTAITVRETVDGYVLEEYWTPRDGAYYAPDIRDKFPQRIWEEALDSQRYVAQQSAACEQKAKIHFGLTDGNDPDENVNPSFNATVRKVLDGSLLVEPFEDEQESGQIYVSTDVISTNPVPALKAGDEIRVVYNGEIQEIYPARINKVFAIYLLSDVAAPESAAIRLEYTDGRDVLPPTVILQPESHTFQFSFSPLSSYLAVGTYTEDDSRLVLTVTEDGFTYTFDRVGDTYVFNEALSSHIYTVRYAPDEQVLFCVPDGAVFRQVTTDSTQAVPEAAARTVATEAFTVTFPTFYVENCYITVAGSGAEQSISIWERYSCHAGYGGHVASLQLMPEETDLSVFGPPYTLYGTMTSPQGKRYHLIAVFPTDAPYAPEVEDTYHALREDVDVIAGKMTPAEDWTFTPAQ